MSFVLWLSDHTELADQVKGLLHIQVEWLECWINTDIILVKSFAFGNSFQGFNGSADELRYIVYTGKNLSIRILLNELEQLSINDFNAGNLVCVLIQYLVLAEHFIFFSNILLGKCLL